MTRFVVVNHFPVLPARGGGQLAVLGLCTQLAQAGPTELVCTERRGSGTHQVQLPVSPGSEDVRLGVTAVANLWRQRRGARVLAPWLGSVDSDIGSMLFSKYNRALVQHLCAALSDGDVLVLCHPWLWPAVQQVLQRRPVWLVFDAHNVEHTLKTQSLQPSWVSQHLVQHIRRLEAEVVQHADLTLACTQRDADALLALPGAAQARVCVGSKGIVPSARAAATAAERSARPVGRAALFVGSDHPPNNAAARWVIQTLAPACPDWTFTVAGACGPAAGVQALTGNVRVLGKVDDLSSELARADVALNPMTSGSGINMKLFEYLQCGLPVLSTTFGARGFEGLGDTGLVLCERDGFAAGLRALQADEAACRRLSAAGVACVQAHFTWPVVGARVRAAVAQMQASARPLSAG